MTPAEWAEQKRYLSRQSSSEHGKFTFDLAPWQRAVLDAVEDKSVRTITLEWPAQVAGKTETLNNILGHRIEHDPCPMLVLQPSLEMSKAWSKDKFAPMLRDTPSLRGIVKAPRSKDSDNTTLHKAFPGGHVTVTGANSAASLRSRPIRLLICDEVDAYPASTGTEGDPIMLAERRTESFPDAIILKASTPGVEGMSKIRPALEQSDWQEWFCPCPKCGEWQTLKWANVRWPDKDPSSAWYECEKCKAHWTDAERQAAVRGGEWRPTREFRGHRGYHLNGVYCLFRPQRGYRNRLHQMAEAFLSAKRAGINEFQVWWNTFNTEPWKTDYAAVETDPLLARREKWGDKIPAPILVLTAGVDVQPDRLEVEVVGWGEHEESWSLEYRVFPGNVTTATPWGKLSEFLASTWTREDGREFRLACVAVDSGDSTKEVYDYCRPRLGMGIWPIKGRGGPGIPIVSAPKRIAKGRIMLVTVGVDACKSTNLGRLKITEPGPGYMHFPARESHGHEYFRQLTAEVMEFRQHHGRLIPVWTRRYSRNEALDCRNYALAALATLNVDWQILKKRIEAKPPVVNVADNSQHAKTEATGQPKPAPVGGDAPRPANQPPPAAHHRPSKVPIARPRGGWVRGWRR